MAELVPAPFGTLVHRAFVELERTRQIFDLPERKFYRARPGFDLAVLFHGQRASNALGPAAGPQAQMLQNIVLSWLAGARIFELKTIQVNDHLVIPRPCIDATNVGYNVEWSQELRLEQSLREYVGAQMLLEMLRASGVLDGASEDEAFAQSEWILDLSVGYDLKGLRSPRVVDCIQSCMDARAIIEELRPQIPARYPGLRDLPFTSDLVKSVTLSTFHGCPAHEIEAIGEFLLRELGLHVTIKLNPTLLGVERCEELLHGELGYEDVRVAAEHFERDLQFADLVPMARRLQQTAAERGLGFGLKLTNTLVVHNHRKMFSDDVMYLSGQPLHVLALHILQDVRAALGPEIPISFSAGIDAHNFGRTMACNLTPITTCTDLLRPGGYGRLPAYLINLENDMQRLGVRSVGDYILRAENQGVDALRAAVAELRRALEAAAPEGAPATHRAELVEWSSVVESRITDAIRGSPFHDIRAAIGAVWKSRPASLRGVLRPGHEQADAASFYARLVQLAGARNVAPVVERATHDPRYAAPRNTRLPRKIGSQLHLYDCINCDKCIPVCPNDANFVYRLEPADFDYVDYRYENGAFVAQPGGRFVVAKSHQIANYADFCNDCGNCDVFCPEDGGPFIEKPRFFSSLETWGRDPGVGFYVRPGRHPGIWGRLADGTEHLLQWDATRGRATFLSQGIEVDIDTTTHTLGAARFPRGPVATGTKLDMRAYHVLRTLLAGMLDPTSVHQINAGQF